MNPSDKPILEALRGSDPPQSAQALAALLERKVPIVQSRLSMLLREGALSVDEIPWRKGKPQTNKGRPRGALSGYHDIAREAKKMVDERGKDRLGALRLLTELRQMGGEQSGPPPPNDEDGKRAALVRIFAAAGPKAVESAIRSYWPRAHVTLVPEEANHVQEASTPEVVGPAVGGDSLAGRLD